MPRRDDLDLFACPLCGFVGEPDAAPARCRRCGEVAVSRDITARPDAPRRREDAWDEREHEADEWVPAPPPRPTTGQRARWGCGIGLILLASAGWLAGLAETLEKGTGAASPRGA